MLKEEAVKKEDVVKRECLKNDHKGFDIVAVDLTNEQNKENDQKKYYCVKCLIEKIGIKKIILYEEAIKKAEIVNLELKKNTDEKHQQTMDSIQKLYAVIKSIEGNCLKQFEDLKKQLDIQIIKEQKKLEKIPEPTTTNDDIKLLSSCYQEDGRLTSPTPIIDYKEIADSLSQIKKLFQQLASFEQLQDADKEILNIEQTCQINLQVDEKQKRTPSLNIVCENHKMEIIMFNLNQTEFEQTNPFLCVECAQDLLTRGNKAVSNTISLMKAEDKWNEYIKDQSEKRSQRQTRLNQAIGLIKKLQEKYNQELNKMIQSLNDQLKKQPKEYEELMKLKNTRLQNQDKQSLLEIVKILGQTEQSKNREQISNQEDSEFYQCQKKVLEELIKENLVVENQIQWIQNYDQQPQNSNQDCDENLENDLEVEEFLKQSTLQDLYLSFFENSFHFLKKFQLEENELKQKGKLQNLIQSKQEMESDSIQLQQYWYQQFQKSQAKLEKLMKADELQTSLIQYKELLSQEKEKKNKITDLEIANKNLSTKLEKALIQIENINQMISKNKNQYQEQIEELKQVYSFVRLNWTKGDTRLLYQDYAQKIYRKIEERTKKLIKNKYLIYSSMRSGLNFNTLWGYIDKMSNLLMIFKSKSQYIFGGYSPCQWLLQSGGKYQYDEQSQSFLFSQTQDEIYPMKQGYYSISGDKSALTFGGQDIKINSDFLDGSSNLGYSYQCTQYTIPNVQNHLFGSPKPNIIECEVIMLTFV